MTPPPTRRFVPVLEACEGAPTLARLAHLVRDSGERLRAIEDSIPTALRASIRPGPVEGTTWCLLVDNNAAAAKLRQVVPALTAELQRRGAQVNSIRLKVQLAGR